jgi:hypothetical protein
MRNLAPRASPRTSLSARWRALAEPLIASRDATRDVCFVHKSLFTVLSFYFSFLSTVPPRPALHLGVAAIGAREPARFGGGSGHVPSVEPSAGSVRYNPAQRGLSWPLSLLS